jgi:hypothetical protein
MKRKKMDAEKMETIESSCFFYPDDTRKHTRLKSHIFFRTLLVPVLLTSHCNGCNF